MKRKYSMSKKSSMPWKKSDLLRLARTFILLFVPAVLAGCAGRPWTEPLQGDRYDETSRLMETFAAQDATCGRTLDGDLSLVFTNALEKKTLAGYLEFSMPTSYKFVVTNPFGQPVFAAAGDHNSFQAINVPERKYMAGSMSSFGLRHKLPVEIFSKSWGEWIMDRHTRLGQSITAIHEDRQARGIWISYRHDKGEPAGQSHLLVDPASGRILARILENGDGDTLAEVTYNGWLDQEPCRQPQEVNITGLEYGAEIRLKLTDVRLTAEERRFQLPVPSGYMKQMMP